MNPSKKLKVEIPGFYYDEEKGKYFKVERKSTPRDHPYRPDNIKQKEKLKLRVLQQQQQQQQQQRRQGLGSRTSKSSRGLLLTESVRITQDFSVDVNLEVCCC